MGILFSIALIVAISYFYLENSANKAQCSVAENDRIWLQNSFHWLVEEFGMDKLQSVQVLRPIPKDFPIDADGSVQSVYGVLRLIATQMDIDFSRIKLSFFKQTVLSAEELLEGKTAPAGLYKGIDESGYFA